MLGLFLAQGVLSYSTKYSHPHFTREAAVFYNHFNPQNQLSSEEVSWLVQGAIDEDAAPRYTNHFYDPVYTRGWNGNLTAKEWAQSPEAQSQPLLPKGNQSWKQAIYLYRQGNKKEALIALGHTLHLIEDVSVPDHTRNDTHIPVNGMESPYEEWVENHLAANYESYANKLIIDGINLSNLPNLDSAFDELARFSNSNFFSEDSTDGADYKFPFLNNNFFKLEKIQNNKTVKVFYSDDESFRLAFYENTRRNIIQRKDLSIDDGLILSDYLSILGPKATQYSASVIDLFFREVEEEEKLGLENAKPRNFLDALRDKLAETLNLPQLASKNQPSSVKSAGTTILASSSDNEADQSNDTYGTNETNESNMTDESNQSNESDRSDKTNEAEPPPIFFEPNLISPSPPPPPPPPDGSGVASPPPAVSAPAPVYGGQWSITPPGPTVGTNANQGGGNQSNDSDGSNQTNENDGSGEVDGTDDSDESNESDEVDESEPTPDLTPPQILSFSSQYQSKDKKIYLSWSAEENTSSTIYYDLEYFGQNIEPDAILILATSTDFYFDVKEKNKNYKFRIRGIDDSGNRSEWNEAELSVDWSHIVISEIKIGGAGTGENFDEFVEFYNPTAEPISLAGWKLRRFSDSGKPETYLLNPFPSNAAIPAYGFYLVAHPEGYRHNVTPDAVYTAQSALLAPDSGLVLYNQEGEAVDVAGWGDLATSTIYESAPAPDISKGFSLERKAQSDSTQETMQIGGEDEILGNGFDGDDNSFDFILRPNPEPQNSESLPEPREGDFIAPGEINDLSAIWHQSLPDSLTLVFTAPENAALGEGAYYDLRYTETAIPGLCLLNINWSRAEKIIFTPTAEEGAREKIIVEGLKPGTEYCFAIKTWNGFVLSNLSNQFLATTIENSKKSQNNVLENITYIPYEITSEYVLTPDKNPYYVGSMVHVRLGGKLIIKPGVVIKFGPQYWNSGSMSKTEILVWGSLEISGTAENPVILTSVKDDRFLGDTNGDENASAPQSGDWGGIRNVPGPNNQNPQIAISHSRIYYGGGLSFIISDISCDKSHDISLNYVHLKNNFSSLSFTGAGLMCETNYALLNNVLAEDAFESGLVLNYGGKVKIRNSAFRNNGNYGIYLEAIDSGQLDIENSNVYGNGQFDMWNLCGSGLKQAAGIPNCVGQYSGYPKQITAKSVWWGSADGPQKRTDGKLKVDGRIDYSEWLEEEADIGL